jgi:hypothetical protein
MHIHPFLRDARSTRQLRLTRSLASALAVAAIAAPAAGARPQFDLGSADGATPPDHDTPVVTRTIDRGFDTGSAAIGAGVAAALLLAAGGLSASHRQHRLRAHH